MFARRAFTSLTVLSLAAPAVASGIWGTDDLDVFDGSWNLGEQHSLVTELMGQGESDALFVRYAFASDKWYAIANYGKTDDAIQTGSEFSLKPGNQQTEVAFGRSWNSHGNWWTQKSLRTTYQAQQLNDGQVLADKRVTELVLAGAKQSTVQVQFHNGRERQNGMLFDIDHVVVFGRLQPRPGLEMGVQTDFGEKFDFANVRLADQQRIDPFLNLKLSEKLRLQLGGTHVQLDTKEGQPILDARVVDAQLTWQIDYRGSLSVTLQQQDVVRNPSAYAQTVMPRSTDLGSEFTWSWQLNPKTELNLGYSDDYADNIEISALVEPDRSWFMNVGYAIGM